jgi:hypothetical protein
MPYKTQNTYKAGRDVESPQISKADIAAPAEEMIMQVVTGSLSLSEPMMIKPMVIEILSSMTVNADKKVEVPNVVRAYVGKKMEGRK